MGYWDKPKPTMEERLKMVEILEQDLIIYKRMFDYEFTDIIQEQIQRVEDKIAALKDPEIDEPLPTLSFFNRWSLI